jgi:hypothetical protein
MTDYLGPKKLVINTEPHDNGKVLSVKLENATYTDVQFDLNKVDEFDRAKKDFYQVEFEKALVKDALTHNQLWIVPYILDIGGQERLSLEFLRTTERIDKIYEMGGILTVDGNAFRQNPSFFQQHPQLLQLMDYISMKNQRLAHH